MDYIFQLSHELDVRVTRKLSQESIRTDSRISGALSRLDDFLQNSLIQGHFGTTPETSGNAFGTIQRANEDDSQCDLHAQATVSQSQNTQNFDLDDEFNEIIEVYHILQVIKRPYYSMILCKSYTVS